MGIDAERAFFSYSREDSDFALRLAADLKAAGAVVWLDQLDINPGQRWDRAVEDALTTSPIMLVILSPSSVSSTNVQDEVAFALEKQKTLIPLLYRDCAVPFRLRRFQYVEFRQDYDRGLKQLIKALGVEQQDGRPLPGTAAEAVLNQAAPEDTKKKDPPNKPEFWDTVKTLAPFAVQGIKALQEHGCKGRSAAENRYWNCKWILDSKMPDKILFFILAFAEGSRDVAKEHAGELNELLRRQEPNFDQSLDMLKSKMSREQNVKESFSRLENDFQKKFAQVTEFLAQR